MFVDMRRLGVVLALLVLAAPSSAQAAPAAAIPTGRELLALGDYRFTLLGLKADPAAERLVAGRGGTILAPDLHIWRLRSADAQRLIPRLERRGALRYAEPDRPVFRQGHLNGGDPLAAPTIGWHHYRVGADRAEPPGPGMPITIIDSGLDTSHMEFAARPNTFLLNEQSVELASDEYHGTMVASTAAAPTDGKGAVGIYPQAVLRAFDLEFLSESIIVEGITRAAGAGRSVINLSLGGTGRVPIEEHAILAAFGTGSLVVASAGNARAEGSPAAYPASFAHVLTIGATNEANHFAWFSSASSRMDLAAPGQHIPVAIPQAFTSGPPYGLFDGTSFSAPLVAGVAAAVWTARPTLTNTQLFEIMRRSARHVGARGWNRDTGYGILDAPAALTRRPPVPDPQEPNEDVYLVKPKGLFGAGHPSLTAPGRGRAALAAHVERGEDREDVYRAYLPAKGRLVVTVKTNANVNLEVWGPRTRTVFERGAAAKRDLLGSSAHAGARRERVVVRGRRTGQYVYLDVFLAKRVREAGYRLSVATARR
jgi:hypothetical protein